MYKNSTLMNWMAINPESGSILSRIQFGNEKNDYVIMSRSRSYLLSSNLPNQYPYLIRSFLLSDSFERNMGVHALTNERYDTSHSRINSSATDDKRILIVDDDIDIARFFKLALERAGFITEVSNNPISALTNFRQGIYDLLLLDINMPQMTGFELYNKIRQIDGEVKVCFITAFEEYYREFKTEFPHLNELECYIKKPVGMDNLIQAVKSRLDCN
jgi:CheY-like chemotaxis protein